MDVFRRSGSRSPSPDLLPGSIVGNARQEYMDADYDASATSASRPTDTRKTLNTFTGPWALVSIVVSAYLPPGHPRNITDRGYGGGARSTLKCCHRGMSALSFPLPMSLQLGKMRKHPVVPGTGAHRRKMAFCRDTTGRGVRHTQPMGTTCCRRPAPLMGERFVTSCRSRPL